MARPRIIDASVAYKWFIDDEKLVVEARDVLHNIQDHPEYYLAPDRSRSNASGR